MQNHADLPELMSTAVSQLTQPETLQVDDAVCKIYNHGFVDMSNITKVMD